MVFTKKLSDLNNKEINIHSQNRYFYTGCLSKADIVLSRINPSIPFLKNASYIKNIHDNKSIKVQNQIDIESISLNKYEGKNINIIQISNYLQAKLSADIHMAILHGSYASGDELTFSDFDGMIILKDAVFENTQRLSKVAQLLSKSCSLMLKLDPLQHHGWFIFSEKDCLNWPETLFPREIIHNSKIIFSEHETLSIHFEFDSTQAQLNLIRLISSIQSKIESQPYINELYTLKSILSEFMLMPSLFLQYIHKKGIYKKYSFTEASKYFHEEDYAIMDEISNIRKQWPEKTSSLQIKSVQYLTPGMKKMQKKKSFPLPVEIKDQLNTSFYNRMYNLTEKVKELIK